ncbi:MAG: P-II family nitrogen regulator [Thermodesulfobacteriota bacterium]
MKEIKAYIRLEKAEEVVDALEEAGVPGFTIIEVKALGAACVPEDEKLSIEYGEPMSPITKLEVVCNDGDLDRLVDIITAAAYTGHKGDGKIFVSEVVCAVQIRTQERGEAALAPPEN